MDILGSVCIACIMGAGSVVHRQGVVVVGPGAYEHACNPEPALPPLAPCAGSLVCCKSGGKGRNGLLVVEPLSPEPRGQKQQLQDGRCV